MRIKYLLLLIPLLCISSTKPIKSPIPPAPMPDSVRGIVIVPLEYNAMLRSACVEAGVPFRLMARISLVESGWNRYAYSKTNDLGMWQLNKKYLDYFSWKFNNNYPVDPYDPVASTRVACRYMAHLYSLCGDYRYAVAAYNCGYTKLTTNGAPASTRKYLNLVFGYEVKLE